MPPKKESKRGSELKGWAVTIAIEDKAGAGVWTADDVRTILRTTCSRWRFQEEKGELKGHRHYQVFMGLKQEQRKHVVLSHFSAGAAQVHIKPIGKGGSKAYWDYCGKEETRVAGPWSSEDAVIPDELKQWAPSGWMTKIVQYLTNEKKAENARKIVVVINPKGMAGKSTLMKHLRWNKIAYPISASDKKSMCREAYDTWEATGKKDISWVLNIGRDEMKKLPKDFWSGIEQIKDGYYADDRHHHKSIMVSCPKMVIMCNTAPLFTKLSRDRWVPVLVDEGAIIDYTVEAYQALVAAVAAAAPIPAPTIDSLL